MDTPSIISVVDDDVSIRASMNNLLSSLGYAVHPFEAAEEFLASTDLNDTSCVIADVQMSAMNGIELLVTMRTRGYAAPVIFISACSDESVRTCALNAGAVCFLLKPVAAPSLIACLDAALGNVGRG